MAIKIEDGDGYDRGTWAVSVEALRQAGVLDGGALRELARYHRPVILDPHGRVGPRRSPSSSSHRWASSSADRIRPRPAAERRVNRPTTMALDPDPYRTLELPRGATLDEVKRAYRRLAKVNHPDAAGEAALPRFLAIQAAYEQLLTGASPGARGRRAAAAPRRAWDADPTGATRRVGPMAGGRGARRRRRDGRRRCSGATGGRPDGGGRELAGRRRRREPRPAGPAGSAGGTGPAADEAEPDRTALHREPAVGGGWSAGTAREDRRRASRRRRASGTARVRSGNAPEPGRRPVAPDEAQQGHARIDLV